MRIPTYCIFININFYIKKKLPIFEVEKWTLRRFNLQRHCPLKMPSTVEWMFSNYGMTDCIPWWHVYSAFYMRLSRSQNDPRIVWNTWCQQPAVIWCSTCYYGLSTTKKTVMSCKVCINSCSYLIAFGRTMFYGSSEMCLLYHCPSLKGTIVTTGMVILVVLTTEIYIIFIDSRYVITLCHTQQMRLWVGTGKAVCLTFTFRQLQNYYFFMKSTAAFVYIVMFEMYEYHHIQEVQSDSGIHSRYYSLTF